MKNNITFDDVAKYTGFSKTTISRYFNKPETLTDKNRDIIKTALKDLNYQENKVAKILARGHTELLGIIVPNFYFQFYSVMINRIINTYQQYGYKFIVFVSNDDEKIERKCIRELMAYKIEGLINFSHALSSSELTELRVPVILVERENQHLSSCCTNNYVGARLATKKLIADKCDIILHLNDQKSPLSPTYQRITGFEETCQENNRQYEIIYREFPLVFQEMMNITSDTLTYVFDKYPDGKKGIFCANDNIASSLLNSAFRKNISIPDELEIIGFDNSPLTEEGIITISTVAQDTKALAQNIMEMMIRKIALYNTPNFQSDIIEHIIINPSFIGRQTTL
ncbi:MAG: LacI family transcriptional regulator [Clostridiales bacterium]|nr:LacI family transcriptional regulator [Clostridiales bacterium]